MNGFVWLVGNFFVAFFMGIFVKVNEFE